MVGMLVMDPPTVAQVAQPGSRILNEGLYVSVTGIIKVRARQSDPCHAYI